MTKNISDVGEFGLIDLLQKSAAGNRSLVKGIGDDTAVLRAGAGKDLLFTTDMLVEGTHFTLGMGAKKIGHKALACNLSDIAAMGGTPTAAVISCGLPKNVPVRFARDLFDGINVLCKRFKVAVAGGDTVRSAKLVINIAMLGEVKKGRAVTRGGAKTGDVIFVTGPLGGTLKSGKHLSFVPRVKEAQFLTSRYQVSSMIDISDGLLADLGHILKAGKKGAVLHAQDIPLNRGARLRQALSGGEDFELLFTLPVKDAQRLMKSRSAGFKFFPIGQIVERRKGLRIIGPDGKICASPKKGYCHF